MTYEQFRKAHPATRCFHKYDSTARSDRAASRRLTPGQRESVGEFFYTHDLLPGVAFSTAKQATTQAYEAFVASKEASAR